MKIGDNWVSLNALQTFQVAARHQHMGLAARELNVTQSAVSLSLTPNHMPMRIVRHQKK